MMKSLCTSSPIDYFLALFRYLNALMIPVSTPNNLQIKEMGGGLGQKGTTSPLKLLPPSILLQLQVASTPLLGLLRHLSERLHATRAKRSVF